MKTTRPIRLALISALLIGRAWADGNQEPAAPAAPPQSEAAPKQEYDALFSDILKSLPAGQRAQVDSAEAAKGKAIGTGKDQPTPDPEELKAAAKAKREKALSELPPEVKARVDKAITELDNRRKEKAAELKELRP